MDKVAALIDFGELHRGRHPETPKAFYNFDLGLNAIDDGERIVVEHCGNADLFDGTTVGAVAQRYRLLLERVTAEPAAELAALSLVSPSERVLLVGEVRLRCSPRRGATPMTVSPTRPRPPRTRPPCTDTPTGPIVPPTPNWTTYADALATHLPRLRPMHSTSSSFLSSQPSLHSNRRRHLDPIHPRRHLPCSPTPTPPRPDPPRPGPGARPQHHRAPSTSVRPSPSPPPPPPATLPPATTWPRHASGSTGQPKASRHLTTSCYACSPATDHWFRIPAPTDVWTLFHSYAFDVSAL